MKKWLNYLPTIFILSIVLSLVFYSSQGSTVQMNYTQFEKIVDEVDFKKSSMTISSTVIQLEGTYEQNSKTVGYKVIVPRTEKNIEKLENDLQRNGGKLTVEDPNQGSVWISILSQIIPFLIIAVFFYFMFSKMGGGGNNKAFEFAKSKARVESNVKVRFKDVAGCEEEKEEVKEIIDECYVKAKASIQAHSYVLEHCAQLLLEKEKIGRTEFEKLFEEEKNAAASGEIVQNSEEKK